MCVPVHGPASPLRDLLNRSQFESRVVSGGREGHGAPDAARSSISPMCYVSDTTLSPRSPWGDMLFYSLGTLAVPEGEVNSLEPGPSPTVVGALP